MDLKPAKIGAVLLAAAVILGVFALILSSPREEKTEPEPTPTATPAPTPTPPPTITAIKLYAFGRQLDDGGITLYVGDKPVELYADIEPAGTGLPVEWSFSNEEAVALEVGEEGMKCTVTVLQPKGKNELTVTCGNLYTAIPVYLWER